MIDWLRARALTESFSDGDDFNDANKRHHNDTETKILHIDSK